MEDRIRHFLHFLSAEQGASPNTISAYGNDLTQFQSFVATLNPNGNPTDWRRIDRDAVIAYILELRTRRYANASIARKVAALKSFFHFLQAEGIIQGSPVENLDSPHVDKSPPNLLTRRQVDTLLEQPAKRNGPESVRDQAMLQLLCATGLQVTELVSVNIDDLSLDAGSPFVRCAGKGAKERTIPIQGEARRALVAYLTDGRGQLMKNKWEPALFLNRRGERLTRQGVWLIVRRYASETQLGASVTPRTLRHGSAAHKLAGGVPLRTVQQILGHANIATTRGLYRPAQRVAMDPQEASEQADSQSVPPTRLETVA